MTYRLNDKYQVKEVINDAQEKDMDKKEIIIEAKENFENAKSYYQKLRGDERSSGRMLRDAEQGVIDALRHLEDMQYRARE